MLTDDSIVNRRSDLLWRAAPGHLVVATVDGDVHQAHGAAPEIWNRIARPVPIGELVEALAASYELDAEQIRTDVIGFLGGLVAAGLLEVDA